MCREDEELGVVGRDRNYKAAKHAQRVLDSVEIRDRWTYSRRHRAEYAVDEQTYPRQADQNAADVPVQYTIWRLSPDFEHKDVKADGSPQ